MKLALLRHHAYSQIAIREGSDRFTIVHRHRNPDQSEGAPYWLPEVETFGVFGEAAETFVALYREPPEMAPLWLQLGARRYALTASSRSTFSPTFAIGAEPRIEDSEVERVFRLFESEALLVEHRYRLYDSESRLRHGLNPFPAWPDEEEDYDLLYHVHRTLERGAWSRVYPRPRVV